MSRFMHLWYRALLQLYPAEFRRQFGAEMLSVLTEQELEASTLSRRERWWCHCRTTCDLIRVGIRERVGAVRPMAVRVIGMLLVAAGAMQVIYDLATPKLSMGVQAWALTLIVCSFGVVLTTAALRNDRRRYG